MKVRFYCVRHGETLFNVTGRVQGICDSPLTEKGIQQAQLAQHALRNVWFHKAFVSPSERCTDTSDIVLAGRYMHAEIKNNLHEMDFGRLEGSDEPEDIKDFESRIENFSFASIGGESESDLLIRIDSVLKETVSQCEDGDNVLLVTHGAFMMGLMRYLGVNLNEYITDCIENHREIIPNAGIMEFAFDTDHFEIVQLISKPELFIPSKVEKTVHFYYVRHGETRFNMEDRFQGWCDAPLTEKGIHQAETAHDYLKSTPFAFACCSTTLRTRRTAQIILKDRNVSLLPLKGLKEVFVGKYEGWKYKENREILEPRGLRVEWKDVGGENYEELSERICDSFALMNSRAKNEENVLVVSHGTYYMNMLKTLFHIDSAAYRKKCIEEGKAYMPNCGVFSFDTVNGEYVFSDYMKDIGNK